MTPADAAVRDREPRVDLSVFDPPRELSRDEIDTFNETWSAPSGLLGWFRTINNVPIAVRFMATAFAFFLIGGIQAVLLRIQLGTPENTFLDPVTYNQIFTMHGTTMMFLFVVPFIEAVANYVMPMLLGTRDLPFPRLTALSFWTYFFGGIFLYSSFLFGVAPDGGWFAYVPLTNREYSPGINMDWWDIGLSVAEIAAMGAAAELIISILRMRAAGMSLSRMPVFAWAMLVTAFMIIFAFTPLIVGTAMLELDRMHLTSFFVPEVGGEPLLWQHVFWFFGHPDVYIMFLPAVGIVSHVVQVFSRRPLVGYPFVVLAIISTGFLSFGLWVHHMFTTGLSPTAFGFFTAASVSIAIPSGIQVFSWIATLWTGRPVWRTPLLFVLGFLFVFVLGGLTGVMVAVVPFNLQVHDSYFVVAHFHYVMAGGVVFPLFAGLYYWIPKMSGRVLSERLGRWNFWVMFIGFNVAFFPMHVSGLLGMPRRVYTYPAGLGWDVYNLISTVGALTMAVGVGLFVVNFVRHRSRGEEAGLDPWGGDSLEWSQTSPPAQAQFQALVEVTSRHPMWEQETLAPVTPEVREQLDDLRWRPLRWRAALVCSVVDARPLAVVHMPGPTLWPVIMSVGFVFLFASALLHSLPAFIIGAGTTGVSLWGWFRPQESSDLALEEHPIDPPPGRLPLAVAGPLANGWWGTLVLILVFAVALGTMVSSYFYLGGAPSRALPGADDLVLPAVALVAAGAAAGLLALAWRWLRRSPGRGAALPLGAAVLLTAASGAAAARVWSGMSLAAAESGYASAVLGTLGFHWLVELVLGLMALSATWWVARRPSDPRGHAVVGNAMLVAFFAVVSALVTLGTVLFGPALTVGS